MTRRRRLVIRLDGVTCPSWNEFSRGGHWAIRAAAAKSCHLLIRNAVEQLGQFDGPRFKKRVNIHVRATFADPKNLLDSDNVCGKFFIDGLKHWIEPAKKRKGIQYEAVPGTWIIEDDTPYHVGVFSSDSILSSDDQDHVIITITETEN